MAIQTKNTRVLHAVEERVLAGWKDRNIHAWFKEKLPEVDYFTAEDYIKAARAKVTIRALNPDEVASMHKTKSLQYVRYTGWRLWVLERFGQEILDRIEGWSVVRMVARMMAARRKHPQTHPARVVKGTKA